jgi:hypothetical protein
MPPTFTRQTAGGTISAAHVNELQARFEDPDFAVLGAGATGTGVVAGCALTLTSGLGIAVASGSTRLATATVAVTGATVTATADGSNPRLGLVTANGATPTITMGTAAASPVLPAVPAGHVVLGRVKLTAGQTTLAVGDLDDAYRVVVPAASSREQALAEVAFQTTSSTTAGTTGLTVPVLVGEVWRFRANLLFFNSGTGGVKVSVTVPTGAAIRANVIGTGASADAVKYAFIDDAATLTTTVFGNFASALAGIQIEGVVGGQSVAGSITVMFAAAVSGQTVGLLGQSSISGGRVTA